MKAQCIPMLIIVLLWSVVVPIIAVAQPTLPRGGAIALELLAEDLTAPVALTEAPDDSGRLFVVDQIGVIHILASDGTLLEEPFLDIRDQIVDLNPNYDERGLLGLAFHPDYANTGRFFVYYSAPLRSSAPDRFNHTNVLSEYRVSPDDENLADPATERILLQVDWPYSNHNGGTLAFGPEDGYLYVSMGDGGNRDDEGRGHVDDWYELNAGGNGQDVEQNLLGSILRLDVDGNEPYGIPDNNPFVGRAGLDEIYAYGLRNPYRFSFDLANDHMLLAGDAGQELFEEVSVITKGGNYGWNVKEGTHCFDAEQPRNPPDTCPDVVGDGHPDEGEPLIDPVIEFRNTKSFDSGLGLAVIGGYVYRGDLLPQLDGGYVFGVWSTGTGDGQTGALFTARPRERGLWNIEELHVAGAVDGQLGHLLLGFGQDLDGEIYVLTSDKAGPSDATGKVFRLVQPGMAEARQAQQVDLDDVVQNPEAFEGQRVEVTGSLEETAIPSIARLSGRASAIPVVAGPSIIPDTADGPVTVSGMVRQIRVADLADALGVDGDRRLRRMLDDVPPVSVIAAEEVRPTRR